MPGKPNPLAEYDLYKKKSMELNNKLMEKVLDRDGLGKAAEQLGIVKDGVMVFKSDQEPDILMDFALYECRTDGRTPVQRYVEQYGGADEIEKEVLAGLLASYTSLFRVTAISKEDGTVDLEDVMRNHGHVQITDRGLSMSFPKQTLLFLRIVPLKGFNKASGFFFAFREDVKSRMMRAYENFYQRAKADSDDTRRYVAFFKANRVFGKQGMLI
ncbi:hypothetical protein [Methanocella sp. MCL-LM]|uniref:hypothetical protein n=1 Tax=Methanocella sp. MCL-LM TaxID=3412035 RepID=UPI003C7826FE